jgi:PKD repeat protein
LTGTHAHTHFAFKIGPEDDETLLDAWILFWQGFEINRQRAGEIRAEMQPLSPAVTGDAVQFDATHSRPGITGNALRFRWTFGDGGTSTDIRPRHVYVEPGIYPVTLTVSDGASRIARTQHITVDRAARVIGQPALVLESSDAVAFRVRPVSAMDVYTWDPRFEPCTLHFTARPETSPRQAAQHVRLRNAGSGTLPEPQFSVSFREGRDWLSVTREGDGLAVSVDAAALPNRHGVYHADVAVDCPGALNSPQAFSVRLEVPSHRDLPHSSVTVDNADAGGYATPWFWLAPQFHRHNPEHWKTGFRGDYLISGGHPGRSDFVRFTPDLLAGHFEISFTEETPFQPSPVRPADFRFAVRVRHKHGTDTIWIEPIKSRRIGIFEFDEGTAGFVDILAEGATGIVVADAVHFERKAD